MTPYYSREGITIYHGDNREVLAETGIMVSAVVTDPPYGLTSGKNGGTGVASVDLTSPYGRARIGTGNGAGGFMGKKWDGTSIEKDPAFWSEVLRVMKPGAYLLSFGGTRTFHRMAVAIEDAGFEIRDTLMWLYGSGFPKSLDVGKAIDKAAGAEREVIGSAPMRLPQAQAAGWGNPGVDTFRDERRGTVDTPITAPATDAARQWDGWGTALKPAWEPIIVARKPLAGTVAANVLQHGTGAINVDACRIETTDNLNGGAYAKDPTPRDNWVNKTRPGDENSWRRGGAGDYEQPAGRWPANVILDEDAAAMLDAQSGERQAGARPAKRGAGTAGYHGWPNGTNDGERIDMGSGGASRFFYVAKASRAERNAGLEGMPKVERSYMSNSNGTGETWHPVDERTGKERDRFKAISANHHPTVKPVKVMEWLITLVAPPDGVVLDPFGGSGSTGVACANLGIPCVLIDTEEEYCEIAARRIDYAITLRIEQEERLRNMPTQLPLTGDD